MTMDREYIEREVVSEGIRKYYYKNPPNSSYQEGFDHGLDKAQRVILNAPVADAVEVVRCKDCLYSTERYGHMECIHGVSYRNTWNKPDFFCAYGERKGGADNEP